MKPSLLSSAAGLCLAIGAGPALPYNFDLGDGTQGSWVTSLTIGTGIRTKNPSCSLTGDPNAGGCGASANTAQWSNGDDGDLNYHKDQAFTGYVSAISELLLTQPENGLKFLARGTALYDPAANHTDRTPLSDEAKEQVVHQLEMLDLWFQKDVEIAGHTSSLRLGNQVINWGESYFASGGINATNALDWQKLLVPGTQLKQALLPAPMLTLSSDFAGGWSAQGYVQSHWNANRYAPVGGYWSVSDVFGRGGRPIYVSDTNFNVGGLDSGVGSTAVPESTVGPGNRPQAGLRVNFKPASVDASFSAYYLNYTDKSPVLSYLATGDSQWSYLKNRQLFGLSTNFTLGDWAIGAEASYRPHDAVSLSPCYGAGGPTDLNTNGPTGIDCPGYIDRRKMQVDVTAQEFLTQSSDPWIGDIGAAQGAITGELTWIDYPGVHASRQYGRTIGGQAVYQVVQAAYAYWLQDDPTLGEIGAAQGTSSSLGMALDFNVTYDGTLLPGWAVTPGTTFYASLRGYTPNFSANYLQGARSANFYLLVNQNPAVWQFGLNYTAFWGGNALSQPYSDRNFIGAFVTRNF